MTSRTWTFETAQKTAADIGFRHFLVMKDGGTVLQAMKHPENSIDKLSGIYLQFRSTGDLYIGRTINLSARQQKHADLGSIVPATREAEAQEWLEQNLLSSWDYRCVLP